MTILYTLQTIFVVFLVAALIWCAFNEDKLIAFEERFFAKIRRRRLRIAKSKREASERINAFPTV